MVSKLTLGYPFRLLFLLVLYFAAGAYHQYSRYGSRGWDLIPNRAFWVRIILSTM